MKKLLFCLALPLAIVMTSCKDKATVADNPFFTEWDTEFGVPPFDKILNAHYLPAFEKGMEEQRAQIDSIASNHAEPSFENTILAYDNSGAMLDRVSRVFFNVNAAATTPEMQDIEATLSPLLSAHNDNIMLNEALFARVKAVYDNSETLDAMQQRLTEKIYKSFVRSGALLTTEQKHTLKQINEQLAAATIKFGNNLLAENAAFELLLDNEEQLAGLPDPVRTAAAEAATGKGYDGKWLFTLDQPSRLPFLSYSSDRELRKKLYNGYIDRCNYDNETDNKAVVNEIIRLRMEQAALLGFATYADYKLDNVMAKTPRNVYEFLDALWKPALESSKQELAEMKELMTADGLDAEDFQAWDWWFYAEKVRKQKYDLNEEMLSPYFALDNVKAGIFWLCNRLYGITFRPINVPLYHTECMAYEVQDKDLSHLGVLYMDFFPRLGSKGGGAWCDEIRSMSYQDGKKISPIVTVVCNFTRPVGSTPSLLTLDETETFFHEFGHALHNFFTDVPYKGLRDVERDFVELPSQIMENWAFEPALLRKYATHYAANTVIPESLISKITNSSLFNQGFITTELVAAAISDMEIHSLAKPQTLDVNAFEETVLNLDRGLITQIAPRYRYPYFSHIFNGGYAVGYYGYTWAEVLDKDAYQAFVESGDIFNADVASRFRNEILSKGGTADGMTLYHNFRGQAPSREPLLRARGLLKE